MKKQILLSGFVLTIISILFISSGCKKDDTSNPAAPGNSTNNISIAGMAFSPAAKTVTRGSAVTWTNNDNVAHTVISGNPGSPNGIFTSGNLANGAKFSFTFNTIGTFSYFCSIHPSMTGTITVINDTTTGGGGYTYP